jgi:hypothetical protein
VSLPNERAENQSPKKMGIEKFSSQIIFAKEFIL